MRIKRMQKPPALNFIEVEIIGKLVWGSQLKPMNLWHPTPKFIFLYLKLINDRNEQC